MFVDLHATLVLGAVVVPLIVAALSPGWRARAVRDTVIAVLPIAAVGVLFLCLLSAAGVPIAEWLFPLVGVVVAGLLVKSRRAFQALRLLLFFLAVALCLNAMFLRIDGYASATASRIYEASDRARLGALGDKLRSRFPADQVLPEGSLTKIVADPRTAECDRTTLQPLWHTFFTGLYQVVGTPGEAWYPGGPVSVGAGQLQWRPKNPPAEEPTGHDTG